MMFQALMARRKGVQDPEVEITDVFLNVKRELENAVITVASLNDLRNLLVIAKELRLLAAGILDKRTKTLNIKQLLH